MDGPTTLFLIRHGQSQANVERVFSNGKVDLPLTSLGRRQADDAARWLVGRGLTHLYTAPLLRARQTAEVVASHLHVPVAVLEDLDEVRVGDLDGRRDEASWKVHDDVIVGWKAGDRAVAFPGGETFGMALARYSAALQEIARCHPGGTVAAVSHGAIQLTVLPLLCHGLAEQITASGAPFSLPNAAITTLEFLPDGLHCSAWGSIAHLSPEAP